MTKQFLAVYTNSFVIITFHKPLHLVKYSIDKPRVYMRNFDNLIHRFDLYKEVLLTATIRAQRSLSSFNL